VRRFVVPCLLALAVPLAVRAEVKLPPILSSHMVLQREMEVPIWGMARPGEKVTVKFRDQTKATEADKAGKWMVKLAALKAGGPDSLTITGTNTITLDDVLVGEVWIGSGQSNMAGGARGYARNDTGLTKLLEGAPYPQLRLARARGGWKVADKDSAAGFSALLLPFGVRLQQELKVPVGLMLGAVGGTPSGRWLTEDMFRADALCQEQVKKGLAGYDADKAKDAYATALKKWEAAAAKAKVDKKPVPRKPVPSQAPGEIRGKFGDLYDAHIAPMAPYAIRGVLWDQGESGTAVAGVDQFAIMGALIKGWRGVWGQDFAFLTVQKPSGGGPAFDPNDPITSKADKFAALPAVVPPSSGPYRELHLKLREHPKTFLVSVSDLGSGIHPTNKSGYGYRSARVALGGVYDKPVEIYGPTYQSHKVEGDKVRVTFSHIGGGLKVRPGEKPKGFALAGEDGKFYWAEAVIDKDTVVLSSAKVKKPVAVRYAWAPSHPWANLFNAAGLPALAFKTDK
jgi:sialate O-acetylesterase